VKMRPAGAEMLELDYNLAELPSSQHRAGLAGLVLMVDWLQRRGTNKGVCQLTRLDGRGGTLRIDLPGLEALFDEVYGATMEEQPRPQPFKDKQKQVVPPLREERQQEVDPKTGKVKTKTVYIYPFTVPRGAFVADLDPSANGQQGVWVKLWRDMVWNILRGVPATRVPFESRARGEHPDDVAKLWKELDRPAHYSVDLPSTYFIGAQATSAENISFKDRARYQFLLHFWPYVAQIYVPAVINNEGGRDFAGYALAVPDVSDLAGFCEALPVILRNDRTAERDGYRPRDAVIYLAVEGALDVMKRLRDRVAAQQGEQTTRQLVFGVDVVHVDKQGNNVRLLGTARADPEEQMLDQYATLRRALWNPLFRRQRMINLMAQRPWYDGFDALLCRLPFKEFFAGQEAGFKYFRRDVRQTFEQEFNVKDEEVRTGMASTEELEGNGQTESAAPPNASCEALVYRVVSEYVRRKLATKYDKKYNAKASQEEQDSYKEHRGKVARDAFLAVRSRSGADFVDFFATTLCSVPQFLSEEQFTTLARDLYEDTDKVRTLTLLALSARG
jgi:CRISPR-associated protein Cmx8